MAGEEDSIQTEIHQHWTSRDNIEVISTSIQKISDYLKSFDKSCRTRLETLHEKLTALEQKMENIEEQMARSDEFLT